MTPRLFVYLSRRAGLSILMILAGLSAIILLADLPDSLRSFSRVEGSGLSNALVLTLLRLPKLALALLPFGFLYGAMIALHRLNRGSEIAVMRSAGVSIWGLVGPLVALALGFGLLTTLLLDPVASSLSEEAQVFSNNIKGKRSGLLRELEGGIWLRERDGEIAVTLHAETYNEAEQQLEKVTLWRRSLAGVFIERWDADVADIDDRGFMLKQARRYSIEDTSAPIIASQRVTSAFDLEDLTESIAQPGSMSLWDLPGFIAKATNAGLETVEYRLRYQQLLALPFQLIAVILIAAGFTLRPIRSGGTGVLVVSGIACGFLIFLLQELSAGMAEARTTPVLLAAWGPTALALILGLTILVYREDG